MCTLVCYSNVTVLGRIACIAWMQPFATAVARSVVCVSVCVGHTDERVQELLNRSRCRLGWLARVGSGNHVLDGGQYPATGSGNLGLSCSSKSIWSLCCGVYSKRDHSILYNVTAAQLLQLHVTLHCLP